MDSLLNLVCWSIPINTLVSIALALATTLIIVLLLRNNAPDSNPTVIWSGSEEEKHHPNNLSYKIITDPTNQEACATTDRPSNQRPVQKPKQ